MFGFTVMNDSILCLPWPKNLTSIFFFTFFIRHFKQLQQLGVPETSIKHGLTTMESDRWIVSVEPTQVTLVDLQNQAQVTRRPMKAEAVVMNPSSNILALRNEKTLQMFNLDTKAKLKSAELEGVVFW